MKYKIFESGTVKEVLKRMLGEGYVPLGSEAVWKLGEEGKIPKQWYDTRSCVMKGKLRQATLKELRNIEKFYKDGGGRLLFYDCSIWSDLRGSRSLLDECGRFVGVKRNFDEERKIRKDKQKRAVAIDELPLVPDASITVVGEINEIIKFSEEATKQEDEQDEDC